MVGMEGASSASPGAPSTSGEASGPAAALPAIRAKLAPTRPSCEPSSAEPEASAEGAGWGCGYVGTPEPMPLPAPSAPEEPAARPPAAIWLPTAASSTSPSPVTA